MLEVNTIYSDKLDFGKFYYIISEISDDAYEVIEFDIQSRIVKNSLLFNIKK